MKFTGGDNLTGLKELINDIFMRNELYNGDGGYEINHAKAGRSGYSFGPVQWDPSTGHVIKKGNTPEEDLRGRDTGYPAPPTQTPACSFSAPGSSVVLASAMQGKSIRQTPADAALP